MERQIKKVKLSHSKSRLRALRMSSQNGSLWHVLNLPVFAPFLGLPAEICNRIYQHALRLNGTCHLQEGKDFPEPALLFTCKTIRREAIGIFYSENSFDAAMTSYSLSMPTFLLAKDISLEKKYKCHIRVLDDYASGPTEVEQLVFMVKQCHENGIFPFTIRALLEVKLGHDYHVAIEYAMISGLFIMAYEMRNLPWRSVERVLGPLRDGFIAIDPEWLDG